MIRQTLIQFLFVICRSAPMIDQSERIGKQRWNNIYYRGDLAAKKI
jgi:hypothetical protein